MKPVFSESDYNRLYELVFHDGYPGYRPDLKEIPNGDGKVDGTKKFAHIATKYLTDTNPDRYELREYYDHAYYRAFDAAFECGMPIKYLPSYHDSALRILEYPRMPDTSGLEYPPESYSHSHTDFDLFTLMCYRDRPDLFVSNDYDDTPSNFIDRLRVKNPQAHLGEIGEEIGLGKATPHLVLFSSSSQHSIVFFAMPPSESVLPSGVMAKDWLSERLARSRTY